MYFYRIFPVLIPIVFLLASCGQVERPEQLKIKVIETSDVHGAIFPYDFVEGKPLNHSMAHVLSYVKQERANTGQVVILVDNGDILQGDPAVYYYNFIEPAREHLVSGVMNYMQYDVATIGNHDVETGHPVYDKIRGEFDFPWLAANAKATETNKPYFKPYTILERNGVKIAVLGLLTPAIPQWLPEQIWEGMAFEDMVESAKYWVEEIRHKEKPDVMIGLFHAGYDFTYNNQAAETYKNENASKLVAEQVPGFDLVLVGHDHHGWNEKITNWAGNEVLVMGPTSKARDIAVAEINLTLSKTTNHYKKDVSGKIVKMEDFEPDNGFMEKFGPQMEAVKKYVSEPLGNMGKAISTTDAFFGDAAFTDMIHRAQMDLTGAEISFTAPLSFNNTVPEGPLYVGDLFKIYRFENFMYTMKLGGQEVKDFLEYSYGLWFSRMDKASDYMLNYKLDENGKPVENNGKLRLQNAYYNFDNAEGINYTVDLRKPPGERVTIISMADGEPFDLNKTYSVAINSYRGNGGGGHLIAGSMIRQELLADRIIASTDKDFRFYLMDWIREKETITPSVNNNWKLLPEQWVTESTRRERAMLFGE